MEQSQLQEELNAVAELIQQCVNENAHIVLDQTEYQERYNGLAERFDRTKARLAEVINAIMEKPGKEGTDRKVTCRTGAAGRRGHGV